MMRNFVCIWAMAFVLALTVPVSAAQAEQPQKTREHIHLTGEDWMASEQNEKVAFLLGVEMMIATEQYFAERSDKAREEAKGKKKYQQVKPSPFAKGWLKVFKDTTRPELAAKIDSYLEANPNERDRHIFDIIWREFIAPEVKKDRQARR